MDYKIIDINSSLEIKTTGAASNPDTVLSTMTFTDNKSHTDRYYLVVSASLEYAGQTGQVVVVTSEIMTATYDTDGFISSVTEPQIPTAKDILDAIDTKASAWIDDLNNKALLRSYAETIRETVDLYDYNTVAEYKDKWKSRYTNPFSDVGIYDPLFDFNSQIGSNENRKDK